MEDIKLLIDNREIAVLQCLIGDDHVAHTVEQLELGDFQIVHKGDIKYILERKTIADLESSVKDGRYKEQKCRCLASGAKYAYIIEGYADFMIGSDAYKIITGALLGTLMRDGIPVLFTSTTKGTAAFLKQIMKRVLKYVTMTEGASSGTLCHGEMMIRQNVKGKKSDNMSQENIMIQQICAIPKLSYKKAKMIVDSLQVKNMRELVQKLDTDKTILAGVDGIGPKLSKSIYESICGGDITSTLAHVDHI
jgi:ERCC4-type nuclease